MAGIGCLDSPCRPNDTSALHVSPHHLTHHVYRALVRLLPIQSKKAALAPLAALIYTCALPKVNVAETNFPTNVLIRSMWFPALLYGRSLLRCHGMKPQGKGWEAPAGSGIVCHCLLPCFILVLVLFIHMQYPIVWKCLVFCFSPFLHFKFVVGLVFCLLDAA